MPSRPRTDKDGKACATPQGKRSRNVTNRNQPRRTNMNVSCDKPRKYKVNTPLSVIDILRDNIKSANTDKETRRKELNCLNSFRARVIQKERKRQDELYIEDLHKVLSNSVNILRRFVEMSQELLFWIPEHEHENIEDLVQQFNDGFEDYSINEALLQPFQGQRKYQEIQLDPTTEEMLRQQTTAEDWRQVLMNTPSQ